jgi:hypothetical protein
MTGTRPGDSSRYAEEAATHMPPTRIVERRADEPSSWSHQIFDADEG